MPSKTEKQRRAMQAAARGKSKIGIPRSVGKKFVQHQKVIDRTNSARARARG